MMYAVSGIIGGIVALFSGFIMNDQKFPKIQTLFTSVFAGGLIFFMLAFQGSITRS